MLSASAIDSKGVKPKRTTEQQFPGGREGKRRGFIRLFLRLSHSAPPKLFLCHSRLRGALCADAGPDEPRQPAGISSGDRRSPIPCGESGCAGAAVSPHPCGGHNQGCPALRAPTASTPHFEKRSRETPAKNRTRRLPPPGGGSQQCQDCDRARQTPGRFWGHKRSVEP